MTKSKLIIFFTVLILFLPAFLCAQTAEQLEIVLGASSITCDQAARFVYASVSGEQDTKGAFEKVLDNGWLPGGTTSEENITLGKLSFLLMKAFDIKGGLMFALFPGPRYAYRNMVSRNIIQGSSDPAMTVSGERFLLILGKILNEQEDE